MTTDLTQARAMALPARIEVTASSLRLPDDVSPEEITATVKVFREVSASFHWRLGDFINELDRLDHLEAAAAVLEEFTTQLAHNAARICKILDPSCRQLGSSHVSFSVAKVAIEETAGDTNRAKEWIRRAMEERLSYRQLRAAIRQEARKRLLAGTNGAPPTSLVTNHFAPVYQATTAARQWRLQDVPPEQLRTVADETEPLLRKLLEVRTKAGLAPIAD